MTRVVIEETANPANSLTLMNRSDSMMQGPGLDEWYLRTDGLDEGWYSPPSARGDLEEDPSGDGAFWPSEYRLRSRVFPIRGGLWSNASSMGQGQGRSVLNRLHNRPLTILVEDENGQRWAHGISRQKPILARPSIYRLEFTLFIECPSPIKVGREVRFPRVGNVVNVESAGDEPTWPTFYLDGPVTVFAAELGGHLLAWAGTAPQGVVIDPQTGIVSTPNGQEIGGIQVDDAFRVPPGLSSITVTTDAPVAHVGVRPGWL